MYRKLKNLSVLFVLLVLVLPYSSYGKEGSSKRTDKKPNIIWIVLEDISQDLGAYGNDLVLTPNLDRLAREGTKYTNAYATSSVCSPSRSAFFTGMYQTSIGAHHHRSHQHDNFRLPKHVKLVSEYMREAGYYSLLMGPKQKTDFNFSPLVEPFDAVDGEMAKSEGAYSHGPVNESILNKPAWKKYKKEGNNKPFFAQINYSETHRTFIHDPKNPINPDKVKVPSYYPDHDLVRRDWALYLETVQWLDQKIGVLFNELKQEKALDNTVVFVFGDHGRAMARGKQWLYDSGIQVPFIVWGEGIAKGAVSDELISLIDVMPTTLSLAGVKIPKYLEGNEFMGENTIPRKNIFAQRDRLGSTEDRIRAVRNKQYKYILNYYPNLPYSQFSGYKKLEYPVVTLMEMFNEQNKLTPVQKQWFTHLRPAEELYDIIKDPEEVHNLAGNPDYKNIVDDMHKTLMDWEKETGDQGAILEDPRMAAKLDKDTWEFYQHKMKSRGLTSDSSHQEYLNWWDKRLKELGK
ncbi:sulfatase [Colwellia sp. UCD-KL20]|uniref:sulfatase family protein n=1 Tax=Colwellia sp. UCD-KL20 TaxID=1917165 RepID=UPI0009FAE1A8|nr:sulfatase [Colwellia sp. UCD-KL20]